MAPFLTAVWSDLLILSYAVPAETLAPSLTEGLEPDTWDGSAWVSLVAFSFSEARVLGWSVPPAFGLCDFPEFNLRLYARSGSRRGVVFVREIVASPIVTGIARLVYNEPYSAVPSYQARVTQVGDIRRVRHEFQFTGRTHMVAATGRGEPSVPAPDSFDTWVKEQAYGFGTRRNGMLTTYRVQHPPWRVYPTEDVLLDIDFAALYGPQWAFLQKAAPDHVTFAEGSHISVYPSRARSVLR